jgi:hypothetical protein
MAKQQAANLLPIIARPETMERLRSGDLRPAHPFLRRAIAVACALHFKDHSLLDVLIEEMEQDPEAVSYHMGYNRIYYGDQPHGLGDWVDDGKEECSRFFNATLRHLRLDAYRHIRVMDVFTLRTMLRDEGRRQCLLNQSRSALVAVRQLCAVDDPELGSTYRRQRKALHGELTEVLAES